MFFQDFSSFFSCNFEEMCVQHLTCTFTAHLFLKIVQKSLLCTATYCIHTYCIMQWDEYMIQHITCMCTLQIQNTFVKVILTVYEAAVAITTRITFTSTLYLRCTQMIYTIHTVHHVTGINWTHSLPTSHCIYI